MLRFFRLIRKKLIEESRVRQYVYYAIGEIFLVVIGILIALQINNWNEERQKASEVNAYLFQIQNELISDLAENASMTKRMEEKDNRIEQVLRGLVTAEDYRRDPNMRRLIRYSQTPFSMNRDGFLSLMNIIDEQRFENSGAIEELKYLYEDTFERIMEIQDVYLQSVLDYRTGLNDKYEWAYKLDPLIQEFDDAELNYLLRDPLYKNAVHSYREYSSLLKTYLYDMQVQKAELIRSIGQITSYNPRNELVEAYYVSLPDSIYQPFLGDYQARESRTDAFTLFTDNDSLKIRTINGEISYLVRGSNNGFQLQGTPTQLIIENDSTLRINNSLRTRFVKVTGD
ncbi:DUF6090 family protein [Balneola sp. MJW-20]|uniref:DUF6090 family protein n=1 Tax=Gracilimonas aurantiaca TaxID=3234185 RepID=UPI00346589A7